MRIIGIAGKAKHGKDQCAKFMQEILAGRGYHFGILPFAEMLKLLVYAENPEVAFDDVWYYKPPEIRELLQSRGDGNRIKFGHEVWLRAIEGFITRMEETFPFVDGVIIPDVRYPNEVDFIRMAGTLPSLARTLVEDLAEDEEQQEAIYQHFLTDPHGVCFMILSDRPTLEGETASHASEVALDACDPKKRFDGLIINNTSTTLWDLRAQCEFLINEKVLQDMEW